MADVIETCDDNKTDIPVSSGSNYLSKLLPVDAFSNCLQGKRHLLVQDYYNAVVNLIKACEMYFNHFGDRAIECAEVYFSLECVFYKQPVYNEMGCLCDRIISPIPCLSLQYFGGKLDVIKDCILKNEVK